MAFSPVIKKGFGMLVIVAIVGGGGYFYVQKHPPKQAAVYNAPAIEPAHQTPSERELEKIADPKAETKIIESAPVEQPVPKPVPKKHVVKVTPKPRAHVVSHGPGGLPSPTHENKEQKAFDAVSNMGDMK